jgi:hypothetical protein
MPPALRIAQRLVGLVDLLQALRGCLVADVDVGMKPTGQRAIAGLDLLLARVPGKAQYTVQVAH